MKVSVHRINAKQRGQLARGEAAVFNDPAETHLIPRLKGGGPLETTHNGSRISSLYRWKGKKGQCGEPLNIANMCRKAFALRELVRRFTGDREAYDSRCSFECANPDYQAALVGIALADTRGGAFKFKKSAGECSYELRKDPEKAVDDARSRARTLCMRS